MVVLPFVLILLLGGGISGYDIGSVSEGVRKIIGVSLGGIQNDLKIVQNCLTTFLSNTFKTLSQGTQLIVNTLETIPKNIVGFVISKWPYFLGGTLLLEKWDTFNQCEENYGNSQLIEAATNTTLQCVGINVILNPLEKFNDGFTIFVNGLKQLSIELQDISDADGLEKMIEKIIALPMKIIHVVIEDVKYGIEYIFSVLTAWPTAIKCIVGKVLILDLMKLFKEDLDVFICTLES